VVPWIEGACRYLVQDRMGRTGARWSLEGAKAVLRLRALRASGDFDDYWQYHVAKEYGRNHKSRYADGEVPNPLPVPTRPAAPQARVSDRNCSPPRRDMKEPQLFSSDRFPSSDVLRSWMSMVRLDLSYPLLASRHCL
jgi:hypothetical protein